MTTKFKVTRQTLEEMHQLAVRSNLDTSSLTWTEVQQVLTLQSLIELLATYKIDLEIELDIKELHADQDTRP